MSKTIDISVENNETDVIIVSLERVGVEAHVGNVERSITVDFGSLPQNIYWDEILDKPNFHPVATSGDYDDLENKPNLHAVATSGDYDDLENKPNLSGVATSGNYADLSGKPRINSVTLNGNKTAAQLGLQPTLTIDATPTEDSTNPVQSGGVFTALSNLIPNNAMFGGVVTPNDEPPYGKDPRYFYLAMQEGMYVNFDNYVVQDSAVIFILDIDENTKRWLYISLWNNPQFLSQLFGYKAEKVENATDGNLAGLDEYGNLTDSGYAPSDFATLDSGGKVPQSQLPSYVDDVLEYANLASFPATGESGKIYVALDTNKTYRWSGSAYVEISQSLALGETSSTAFAGDRGKAIEDKIPSNASSSNKLVADSDVVHKTGAETITGVKTFDNRVILGTGGGLGGGLVFEDIINDEDYGFIIQAGYDVTNQVPEIIFYGNYADEAVRLSNIADPSRTQDAANKSYVDTALQDKLDAPSTAGTSGQVLTSDGQGGQSWQTPQSGGGGTATDVQVNGTSITSNNVANILTNTAYNASSNKIATMSDLPSVPVTDVTVGGTSVVSGGVAAIPAIPTVPNSVVNATSQQDGTVVLTMVNGDTITIDLNHQHPNYYSKVAESTQPSGGMLPDVVYELGTLTGATTFSFAAAVSGNLNHYYFTFTSGSTAVVPTWPASITSWDGNCVDSTTGLPVIVASKTYEVSVLDGNAIIKEW